MTEQEREELIEKMARALAVHDGITPDPNSEWCNENWHYWMPEARAALEVAEPVIRDECAEECERRATAVGNGKDEYALACRHNAAAIREGGKDDRARTRRVD
jgi:hypothetical protein